MTKSLVNAYISGSYRFTHNDIPFLTSVSEINDKGSQQAEEDLYNSVQFEKLKAIKAKNRTIAQQKEIRRLSMAEKRKKMNLEEKSKENEKQRERRANQTEDQNKKQRENTKENTRKKRAATNTPI